MAQIALFDTEQLKKEILDFIDMFVRMKFENRYLPEHEAEEAFAPFRESFEGLSRIRDLSQVKEQIGISGEKLDFFMDRMGRIEEEFAEHNERYTETELDLEKIYLDDILKSIDPKIRLDTEQRKVVIDDSDASLVVAGAGAGKTTTMAAKVKYLVEKQHVDPEEIIVISFTRKAVKELQDKIQKQLGIPAKVTTFHAFGNEIIRGNSEDYPEIETYKRKYFIDILKNRIYDKHVLLKNILLFFGYYMDIPEEALEFDNLAQYHMYRCSRDFESMKSIMGSYSKEVIDNLTRQTRTIKGEFLRSVQEVQIANFLYLHNIDYEYEKVYEFDILNARKKYTPDFFLRQGEKEVYLEHFGIREDGTSSFFTEQELEKYKKSVRDKIALHRRYGTKLIYTFSGYTDQRTLLEHLEALLREQGFELNEKDDEEVYRQLVKLESDKYIFRFAIFMESFISRFKTNGYVEKDFDILKKRTDNVRSRLFLDIAREVYREYQAMLIQNRKIDFEDMINRAEEILRESDAGRELKYKYIIIDEYQDIARQRFNLTKRLAEVCRAKIIAVGDDWQSIYAFSGSDITLFTQFIQLMGHGKMLRITKTYRNSQELIDIAGNFIQENKSQISKRLQSPKHIKDPVVIKLYDDSEKKMQHKAEALNSVLGSIGEEFGEEAEVLLIGRYGFEINQFCKTGEFSQKDNNKTRVYSRRYPKMKLFYMTAHSSKGLGYDNVVILNGAEGKFGFPSQIEDDPIMKLVTVEDRSLPFAEERRLFYVALTRTKNRTYILTPENHPSRFVFELVEKYGLPVERKLVYQPHAGNSLQLYCPVCGSPLKKEYNRNYGLTLYMCTNEPEICDFMANRSDCLKDIHKCRACGKGYMIVKQNRKTGQYFFGCTNWDTKGIRCKNSETIE